MTKRIFPKVLLSLSLIFTVCAVALPVHLSAAEGDKDKAAEKSDDKEVKDVKAVIKTEKGDIEVTIFAKKAPLTSASFLNLAKHGYFNGLNFHRVEPGFVIQGGDPEGTGRGGPGYEFAQEVSPELTHSKAGILSMANAGPGTNGSQFFITLDATPSLDGSYNVFGEVTGGLDVVKKIKVGDKMTKVEVKDSTDALFKEEADNIKHWDAVLKAKGFIK